MDELVEQEAKIMITNGIEKASGASGVDIKVSQLAYLASRRASIVTAKEIAVGTNRLVCLC